MATQARPLALGTRAPQFLLPNGLGRPVDLADQRGVQGTLIAFLCNHCPYVLHMRDAFVRYAADYAAKGLGVIAINPNDAAQYREETPARIAEVAKTFGFPYLVDAEQTVALAYDAVCTPELYLFDADLTLFYHGRFDETRPGSAQATGAALRSATDLLLAGAPAPSPQIPSIGCSIKWKPGSR